MTIKKAISYTEAVDSFLPGGGGYDAAWKLLNEGYGPLEVARLTGVEVEDVDRLNEVLVKAAKEKGDGAEAPAATETHPPLNGERQ